MEAEKALPIPPKLLNALADLERALGHHFKEHAYLVTALTHSSYSYEEQTASNERLEFLGDAVLGLSIAEELYKEEPAISEGRMTKLRAAIVCEGTLSELARDLNLGDLLRLGHGESKSGGGTKDSNLADAMEALIAAVYLDSDYPTCSAMVRRLFAPYKELALADRLSHDYKTQLYEYVQSIPKSGALKLSLLREEGPVHDRTFTSAYEWQGRRATGQGKSKKQSEQAAARELLHSLGLSAFGKRRER